MATQWDKIYLNRLVMSFPVTICVVFVNLNGNILA